MLGRLAAFPILRAIIFVAIVVTVVVIVPLVRAAQSAPPPTAGAELTETIDDLDADLDTLAADTAAVGATVGQLQAVSAQRVLASHLALDAGSKIETIRAALENAYDKITFRRARRAQIRGAIYYLGTGLAQIGGDMNVVARDLDTLGKQLIPAGQGIAARGAKMWSPKLFCSNFPLGPKVRDLGGALSQLGNDVVGSAVSFSELGNALSGLGNDLALLVTAMDVGGEKISAFRTRLQNVLADLKRLGPAQVAFGNGIAAVGSGFMGTGSSLQAVGADLVGFADCRDTKFILLPGRRQRNLERNAGIRSAGAGISGKGAAVLQSGVQMKESGQQIAAKGAALSVNTDALGKFDFGGANFGQFVSNFATCPEWFTMASDFTRFPEQFDTHAAYSFFAMDQPPGNSIGIRSDAYYPNVAYFAYATYTTANGKLFKSLLDKDIAPLPGSTNPFVFGAKVAASPRQYRMYALPSGSPLLGKLAESTIELPGNGTLTVRNYLPPPGYNAVGGKSKDLAADLPWLTAVSAVDLEETVCPGAANTGAPSPSMPQAKAFQPPSPAADGKIGFYRTLQEGTPFPEGETRDKCTKYLSATLDPKKLAVLRIPKLANTFDNRNVNASTVFLPTEARYISLGLTGASKTYRTSTVTYGSSTYQLYGSMEGNEMKRVNGGAYFVVIPSSLSSVETSVVLRQATARGYNVMTMPEAGAAVQPFAVLRMKVPQEGFRGDPESAPCEEAGLDAVTPEDSASGDPTKAMGEYAPSGQTCDVTEFLNGSCGAIPSAPPPTAGGWKIDSSFAVEVRWIARMYRDLLNRDASLDELKYWVEAYYKQGRAAVATGIVKSYERKLLVANSLFQTYLKRSGGPANPWADTFEKPYDLANAIAGIGGSAESLGANGGCAGLVSALYTNILGRPADPGALGAWGNVCQTQGPYPVARGIVYTQEAMQTQVNRWYQSLLGRQPDPTGFAGFLSYLQSGMPVSDILLIFVNSEEYFQKK